MWRDAGGYGRGVAARDERFLGGATGPRDSGYVVFFSEFDPDDPDDRTPTRPVCLDCLLGDGDEQLGRGLDMAKRHGQVDYPASGEWFVPDDVI